VSRQQLGAEALLDLVAEALKSEIAPVLPPEKRYLTAMIANAIDIARRETAIEDEAQMLALLDTVYEDGDGTLRQLAKDIRAGAVNDTSHASLRAKLKAHLVNELKVRNPRFLASRGLKG
jgi:hypothetical protein